jgi:polar amino acid transport system substrate-binding protein
MQPVEYVSAETTLEVVVTRFLVLVALFLFLSDAPTAAQANDPAQVLAPTGRLRVALLTTNPVLVSRDTGPVEIYGLAPDLGRTLADRLHVPFQPIRYTTAPQLLSAANNDVWDVTFLTIDPERALVVDFTAPYLEVENGLLAAPRAFLASSHGADTAGIRIAVVEGSSNSLRLSRTLKSAQLVRVPNYDAVVEFLRNGQADAFADNRHLGMRLSERLPGARMLLNGQDSGRYAMALPKGNPIGHKYLSDFIDRARRSGHVAHAVAQARLQGVTVVSGR